MRRIKIQAGSSRRDLWLFAALVLLGSGYCALFAVFVLRSEDFILAGRERNRLRPSSAFGTDVSLPLAGIGACLGCLREGWNAPEPGFVWSRAEHAIVVTPPVAGEVPDGPLGLVFNMTGAFLSDRPARNVRVAVNGVALGTVVIDKADRRNGPFFKGEPMRHALALPGGLVRAGESLTIETWTEPPDVPARLGLSGDSRPLALAVRSVGIERSP